MKGGESKLPLGLDTWDAPMSDLQDTIVQYLTNSFIQDRAVDPRKLAEKLQRDYPGVGVDELISAVRRVASGIGVRIKETSDDLPHNFDQNARIKSA